jgi:methyl-accepting chemotaxis protein
MKGAMALCLKELVVDKFGEEKWLESLTCAKIIDEPILTPMSDLDDDILMRILDSVCLTARIPKDIVIDSFGEYWVTVFANRLYNAHYSGMKNAKDFLLKLDGIHEHVSKHMKNAMPPRFTYEKIKPNKLLITYLSSRNLMDIFIGLIKGVGTYFSEKLKIVQIDEIHVEVTFQY